MSTPRERLAAVANQLPPLLALVLLWMLLWGEFSWLNVLVGLMVGLVVSVGFYLVPVQLSGRVNPWHTVLFFLRLLIDIVRASVDVAWLAVKPKLVTSNAILAIPLRTRSDLILTWTAVATSIVPGSIVIDIDRESSTLFLHVLNMGSARDIERFRRRVLDTERRIVRGFGSHEDIERIRGVLPENRLSARAGDDAVDLADAQIQTPITLTTPVQRPKRPKRPGRTPPPARRQPPERRQKGTS